MEKMKRSDNLCASLMQGREAEVAEFCNRTDPQAS